jgi:hypothetical protein
MSSEDPRDEERPGVSGPEGQEGQQERQEEGQERQERLLHLLAASDEGTLVAEDERELLVLLRSGAWARRILLRHTQLTNGIAQGLRRHTASGAFDVLNAQALAARQRGGAAPPRSRWRSVAPLLLSFAAAVAGLLLIWSPSGEDARLVEAPGARVPVEPPEGRGAVVPPVIVPAETSVETEPSLAVAASSPRGGAEGAGRGHPPAPDTRTVFDLLRSLPAEVLHGLGGSTAQGGRSSPSEIRCAAGQVPGIDRLLVGVILERGDWVKDGWSTIEATLGRPPGSGGFVTTEECDVIWLAQVPLALDAIEQSPFAAEYADRIALADAALRRASKWLMAEQRPGVLRVARLPAQYRIASALALAGVGARLERVDMTRAALGVALPEVARQRGDGHFPGPALRECVEFHALQVRRTVMLSIYLRDTARDGALALAAREGGAWLVARLGAEPNIAGWPDLSCGARDGSPETRVRWALALHGARFDAAVLEALRRPGALDAGAPGEGAALHRGGGAEAPARR